MPLLSVRVTVTIVTLLTYKMVIIEMKMMSLFQGMHASKLKEYQDHKSEAAKAKKRSATTSADSESRSAVKRPRVDTTSTSSFHYLLRRNLRRTVLTTESCGTSCVKCFRYAQWKRSHSVS